MFKKEIKFIYDFNVNEVKKLGNFVTYEQLLSANIHPAILQYISADIDYLIFEDRQKILSNSIFDYSGEKIQQHFTLVGDEIKRTKRFSLDYMSKLVLHASSFTINFLARPRWALTKFIFDDENHKNTTEIKQILNYLYYYGYLRRIIVSYINRKKILSINESEFAELLDKIDNLAVESNQRVIVQNSLKSMADFFSIGDTSGRGVIPFKTVEHFLEEKNLPAHLDKFRISFNSDDRQIGLTEYINAFDEVLSSKTEEDDDEIVVQEEFGEEIESEEVIEAREEIPEGEEEGIEEEEREIGDEDLEDEVEEDVPDSTLDEESEDNIAEELPEEDVLVESSKEAIENLDLEDEKTAQIENNNENEILEEVEDKAFQLLVAETTLDLDEPDDPAMNFEEEQSDNASVDISDDVENELLKAEDDPTEIDDNIVPPDMVEDSYVSEMTDETEVQSDEKNIEVPEETENTDLGLFDALEEELEDDDKNTELNEVVQDIIEDDDKNTELNEVVQDIIDDDDENGELENTQIVGENEELDEEPPVDEGFEIKKEVLGTEDIEEIKEESFSTSSSIDISDLLENRNLTNVIEVIFDYDMEDFAHTIESACKMHDYDEALIFLDKVFETNHIDSGSKEAEALKSVVLDYFNKMD